MKSNLGRARLGRAAGASRGQVMLPALLIIPTLFLFIFMIYETGRLSKEKIRHQFAMDAASFVEMNQYTDFLNRMAYLNGGYPDRIAFDSNLVQTNLMQFTTQPPDQLPNSNSWSIEFHDPVLAQFNVANPPLDIANAQFNAPGSRVIIDQPTMARIVNDYQNAYTQMESVAKDQWRIFQDQALQNHALARKSLWLNVSDDGTVPGCNNNSPAGCASEAVAGFPDMSIRYHYLDSLTVYPEGFAMGTCTEYQPVTYTFNQQKLYQISTIPPAQVMQLANPGVTITQHWAPPSNYFGIDFGGANAPQLIDRVISVGGSVWPDPTPKFYTELLPGPPTP